MATKKLGIAAGAGIAVLLAVWFGGSWYASNKAQEKLEEFVVEHRLQGVMHWSDVSASLFGGATISNVSIGSGKDAVLIKEVEVRDFVDDYDRKSIDFSVHELSDVEGNAPAAMVKNLAVAMGKSQLAPINADIKLDVDFGDDEAMVDTKVAIPEAGQVSGQFNIQRIRTLRSLMNMRDLDKLGGFAVFGVLQELNDASKEIRFVNAKFAVKDEGAVKRMLALYKRYAVTPLPGVDLEKSQQQAVESRFAQIGETCLERLHFAGVKSACDDVKSFLMGEKSGLSVSIKSKSYYNLEELVKNLSKGDFIGLDVEVD